MSFLDRIFGYFSKETSSKELSLQSWTQPKFEKKALTVELVSEHSKMLRVYWGEEKFKDLFEKYRSKALEIEKEVNFISHDGNSLSRQMSFVLSFDMAQVLINHPLNLIRELTSVVIYPSPLPIETNTKAFTISKGPKSILPGLDYVWHLLDLIHQDKNQSSQEEINFIKQFDRIKEDLAVWFEKIQDSNLNADSLQEFKDFLNSTHLFIIENIKNCKAEDFNSEICADSALEKLSFVLENINNLDPTNHYSIHLSWSFHLQSITKEKRNLLIHETAQTLDQQKSLSKGHFGSQCIFQTLTEELFEKKNFIVNSIDLKNSDDFFALCSEIFFSNPTYLKNEHPKLFNYLEMVYGESRRFSESRPSKDMLSFFQKIKFYDGKNVRQTHG